MTIAKYIRLSSADEAARFGEKEESNSIVNQRRLLDDYIAASEEFAGWRVLEFQDDGQSGTSLNRPGIQSLLAQARLGEIDCVIVKDLSQKVKLAKKQYARRGQSTAAYPCFGYMKLPEDKHIRIPDPMAAEVVRRIFDWCIAGKGATQIARLLNAEGVPTPSERKRQLGARRKSWGSGREKNE